MHPTQERLSIFSPTRWNAGDVSARGLKTPGTGTYMTYILSVAYIHKKIESNFVTPHVHNAILTSSRGSTPVPVCILVSEAIGIVAC